MHSLANESHLTDAELLLLLDEEGSAALLERWRAHLAACPDCLAVANEVNSSAQLLDKYISEFELPYDFRYPVLPPPRDAQRSKSRSDTPRPLITWMRRAAVFLFVIWSLSAVSPLRAWILSELGRAFTRHRTAESSERPVSVPLQPKGPIVSVPTADGRLVIEFEFAGDALGFRIERTDQPEASITGVWPSDSPPLIASGLLRIRRHNAVQSTSYQLRVPKSVHQVRVRAGQAMHTYGDSDLNQGVTITR